MSSPRQHTPGPWTADIYCVWAGEIFVCGTQTGLPVERQIANARLIASAPDLLAACLSALRALEDNLSPGPMDEDAKAGLRAAIARATGGAA